MQSEPLPPLALSREAVLRRAPFPLEVVPSVAELHRRFVRQVLDEIRAAGAAGRTLRLTLPVGPFDYALLADTANEERVTWRQVVLYPIDEFALPDGRVIAPEHPWSLRRHLTVTLLDRLDPALAPAAPPRWLTPDTLATISAELARAPLDFAFFGFGVDGHVAMNCPAPALSVEQFRALGVRHVHLSRETITQIAMGGAGGDLEAVPTHGLTLGMRELLGARALRIYLMRTWQPAVMRRAFFGPVSAACPASLVQTHPDVRATIVSYVADAPWHETTQRP